jgi:hypothetical protein
MKRIVLLAAFILSPALLSAGRLIYEPLVRIGPQTSTSTVSISAGGAATRNCITNIDVISTGAYTFRVLNGGSTFYELTLGADQGIVRSWDVNDPLCGTANTAMQIKVSTSAAGTYQINYMGFTAR